MNKYTLEQKEYIYNLYESGLSYNEIVEECREKFGIEFHKTQRADKPTCSRYYDLKGIIDSMKSCKKYQLDEKQEYKRIATARKKLLVDRKINTQVSKNVHKEINGLAFRERVLELLKDYKPNYKLPNKPITIVFKKHNPIYIISDEHFRGNCDISTLNRVFEIIEQDIIKNKYTIINIFNLGDNIEGLLHKGSINMNDGAIISAITYANIVSNWLIKLSKNVYINFVYTTMSNHSQTRTLNTERDELAKEDLGLVIDELFKTKLQNIKITYRSNPINYIQIDGKNFLLLHGHQKFAISRIKLVDWCNSNNYNPDFIILGHFHNMKINEFGINKYMITCPAVKSFISQYETNYGFKLNPSILKLEVNNNSVTTTQLKLIIE